MPKARSRASYIALRYLPFAITSVAVVFLSVMKVSELHINSQYADKWTHLVMYFGFCLTLLWADSDMLSQRLSFKTALRAFFFASCFGMSMEMLQGIIGYRSCSCLDAIANAIGALLAAVVCSLISSRWTISTK